jgi:tripartite-type tricarboxylate transporter receptor subunit TctC
MVRQTGNSVARLSAFVVTLAAGLLLIGIGSLPASAQVNSGKPIRIIIPFGPAGSADVIARLLQQPLGQALQQNIIIENRPEAGSNLGTAAVAPGFPRSSRSFHQPDTSSTACANAVDASRGTS